MKTIYLKDIIPCLANEIKDILTRMNMSKIASQIDGLRIYKRCDCPDAFCSSFYTAEGKESRDVIILDIDCKIVRSEKVSDDVTVTVFKKHPQDMIMLDLDDEGNIVFVEILFRPEINHILDEKVYRVEKHENP